MGMVPHSTNIDNTISPLCSVCIANYNGEYFIEQCIDSILKQENVPGAVEIIVHDDASTDDSVALIQRRYPEIRLILSEQNLGFCASNNKMVAAAKGEFILLLNNDATLHIDALKTLYDASIVYGVGIYGLPQYDASTGELIDIGSIFDPFLNPIPNKDSNRNDVGMVIGACLFLSRHLWDTLGGFPEWFGSLAEDMYLCCLARLWGFSVKAISESGFNHWVGKSIGGGKVLENKSLSTTYARRFLSERNKSYVMITCYPLLSAYLLLALHFILLTLEGISLSLIKWDKQIWRNIYWNAMREVLQNRNVLINTRNVNQKLKGISTWNFFSPFSLVSHKISMLIRYGIPQLIQK